MLGNSLWKHKHDHGFEMQAVHDGEVDEHGGEQQPRQQAGGGARPAAQRQRQDRAHQVQLHVHRQEPTVYGEEALTLQTEKRLKKPSLLWSLIVECFLCRVEFQ